VSDRRPNDQLSHDQLQTAARAVARAKRLAVFTGAGVSKESGIPTFREPETGLWAQYDPMELATAEAYFRDPAFVWSWYEHRFGALAAAKPNPGHRAIAELEQLLPRVTVITQNIDGLHQRAGSTDVVELHGSMQRFKCIGERHAGFRMDDIVDQDEKPPRCPRCGDIMRPDVVWFGEALPGDAIDRAQVLSVRCDVMLVVGTSGVVYPAAAMPLLAAQAGALVIDVNPERDALAAAAGIFLRGAGGEVLPRLVAAVRQHLAA
jgi:NAD-dependent deacetylase